MYYAFKRMKMWLGTFLICKKKSDQAYLAERFRYLYSNWILIVKNQRNRIKMFLKIVINFYKGFSKRVLLDFVI